MFDLFKKELLKTSFFRPDGDVEMNLDYSRFELPDCSHCKAEGSFRPSIIFFGENCKPDITERSIQLCHEADFILVVGTSLVTQSSYRLVKHGIIIFNQIFLDLHCKNHFWLSPSA